MGEIGEEEGVGRVLERVRGSKEDIPTDRVGKGDECARYLIKGLLLKVCSQMVVMNVVV